MELNESDFLYAPMTADVNVFLMHQRSHIQHSLPTHGQKVSMTGSIFH